MTAIAIASQVFRSCSELPETAIHVGLVPDLSAKSASHLDRRHSVAAPRLSGRFAET
jgi:hypothetical protein